MNAGEAERIICEVEKLGQGLPGEDADGVSYDHTTIGTMIPGTAILDSAIPCSAIPCSAQRQDCLKEMRIIRSTPKAFSGAAARFVLFECQRCGRCYIENNHIALRPDDCSRMANSLGLSEADFLARYTQESADPDQAAMGTREILKMEDAHCPFYDSSKKGRSIYDARPSVCRCYPTLTEDVIRAACKIEMLTCTNCPASIDLLQNILSLSSDLARNAQAETLARSFFWRWSTDSWQFFATLHLKACQAAFSSAAAEEKIKPLGLRRIASEKEIADMAMPFLAILETPGEIMNSSGPES